MNEKLIKILPNPTEYPILPPDMDYLYFENAHLFPFEPFNKEFSPANAWWLSECAFLVYCHPGFARMAMKLIGFDNFRFFQGKGTECLVCWNTESTIVSFRGTEMKSLSMLHEIRTDLNTTPVPFEMGGKVHKGFLRGLEEIWGGEDGLNQFLSLLIKEDEKRPIWITGHSLGGALAALCFTRIPQAAGLYLYGAPRIGDREFVNLTKDRPVWRFEHGRDPIPMVPPDVPALNFNFKDMGQLVFIDKEGQYLFERPVVSAHAEKVKIISTINEQKNRRESFSKNIIKNKNLLVEINDHFNLSRKEWKDYFTSLDEGIGLKIQDHMPIYYCSKIWNYLISKMI